MLWWWGRRGSCATANSARISGNSSRSCGFCEIPGVTEVGATEAGLSLLQGVPAYVEIDPCIIPRELHQGWLKICLKPGATPGTHPELWDWGAPQLHPPTVTPSTSEKETCFKLFIFYDFLAKIEKSILFLISLTSFVHMLSFSICQEKSTLSLSH